MSGTEGLTVSTWLWETLTNDAQLASMTTAVYDTLAPPNAVLPYIVISEQVSPADTNGLGATRILSRGVWQVRVTVEGMSWVPAAAAAQRIDTLLQGATSDRGAEQILGCVRQSALKLSEQTPQGASYRHLGALWEITVS